MGSIQVLRDDNEVDVLHDEMFDVLVFMPPNINFDNEKGKLVSIDGGINYCLSHVASLIENELYGDKFTMVIRLASEIRESLLIGDFDCINYMCYKLAQLGVNHSVKMRISCCEEDAQFIADSFKRRVVGIARYDDGLIS